MIKKLLNLWRLSRKYPKGWTKQDEENYQKLPDWRSPYYSFSYYQEMGWLAYYKKRQSNEKT